MLLFMISCTMIKISVVKGCLACHLITSDIVRRAKLYFPMSLGFFFCFNFKTHLFSIFVMVLPTDVHNIYTVCA